MVDRDAIRHAAQRIAPFVHRTPVLTCAALDAIAGAQLFFKAECFQKVGAFKIRGATNAVQSMTDDEARRGVATHSSGNHAAALALAGRARGIAVTVVMPESAPAVKVRAVEGYGARIVRCGPTLAARETTLAAVLRETGAAMVHPYDDDRVIAGQGTAALELCEQIADLDVVLAPIGGGGLVAGTAIACDMPVVACEPAGADDAARSFRSGVLEPQTDPRTIADGLRASLSPRTFAIVRSRVSDVVTVSEEAIIAAVRLVLERMKIVIEPSAAVPVAAALEGRFAGQRVGILVSGGNLDFEAFFTRS